MLWLLCGMPHGPFLGKSLSVYWLLAGRRPGSPLLPKDGVPPRQHGELQSDLLGNSARRSRRGMAEHNFPPLAHPPGYIVLDIPPGLSFWISCFHLLHKCPFLMVNMWIWETDSDTFWGAPVSWCRLKDANNSRYKVSCFNLFTRKQLLSD